MERSGGRGGLGLDRGGCGGGGRGEGGLWVWETAGVSIGIEGHSRRERGADGDMAGLVHLMI